MPNTYWMLNKHETLSSIYICNMSWIEEGLPLNCLFPMFLFMMNKVNSMLNLPILKTPESVPRVTYSHILTFSAVSFLIQAQYSTLNKGNNGGKKKLLEWMSEHFLAWVDIFPNSVCYCLVSKEIQTQFMYVLSHHLPHYYYSRAWK